MSKPLIGINPYYFCYRNNYWNGTQEKYYKAVWEGGGIPVTLNYPENGGTITELVESIDGLLAVGGPDLPIHTYNGKHPELLDDDVMHPKREEFDRKLFFSARNSNNPILSICAGLQHINVMYGGTLYEDVKTLLPRSIYHGEFNGEISNHKVNLSENSLIHKIMGTRCPLVASTHHQGICKLGTGLRAVGFAEDGLIEAIEDEKTPDAFIAVQWHPELSLERPEQVKLFNWLSTESIKRKRNKRLS